MLGACPALTRRSRRKKSSRSHRRGVTTVEFAMVAPVVFMLVMALIQYAALMMNQNLLTAAAREGARVAALAGTNSVDVIVSEVEERLTSVGIDPDVVTVNVDPTVLSNLRAGDEITVSLSSPMNEMTWVGAFIPCEGNLSAEICYQRE
jgi:Flp pilus assembly protein TadG